MYKEFSVSLVFCSGLLVAKTKDQTDWKLLNDVCMYDQEILAQKILISR